MASASGFTDIDVDAGGAALLAGPIPARRAASTDAAQALRIE